MVKRVCATTLLLAAVSVPMADYPYVLPNTSGLMSTYGGPGDSMPDSTMAVTGESFHNPIDGYGIAMRWQPHTLADYAILRHMRVLVTGPRGSCVFRPADWGPNTRTGRNFDLGHVGAQFVGQTDDFVTGQWVPNDTPLGPIDPMVLLEEPLPVDEIVGAVYAKLDELVGLL